MTTPHTPPAPLPDVAAIEALLSAATPLPWMQAHHIEEPRAIVTEARRMLSLLGNDNDGMAIVFRAEDAALIVAAVNALPALLAALRTLAAQHAADVAAAVDAASRSMRDACAAQLRARAACLRRYAAAAVREADATEYTHDASEVDACAAIVASVAIASRGAP